MADVYPELTVVVFAYNEAENVAAVLTELCQWLAEFEPASEIIFVDDGSEDRTQEVAAEVLANFPGQVLRHHINRGIGASLKTGVSHARGEWVTFMPADGQIDPVALGVLRRAQKERGAEVVFSVYSRRDDGIDRKILSWGARALIQLVHGVHLKSDGPYLFRRQLFLPAELPSDSFFLNFEFPIRVLDAGLPTAVVSIMCRARRAGRSKSANGKWVGRVASELFALRSRRMKAWAERTVGRRF